MLRVADFFDLEHLKQLLELMLVVEWQVVQLENVVSLYEHACHLDCRQLKAACVGFIRDSFDVVSQTPEWGQLSDELREPVVTLTTARRARGRAEL